MNLFVIASGIIVALIALAVFTGFQDGGDL